MAAQGISKQTIVSKQSALGTPALTGGQIRRRRTSMFTKNRDTYENDEIVEHQQSTGATAGINRITGKLSGLLSAGTYALEIAAALRSPFTAVTALTALSITIAGSAGVYTATRATGDFLASGVKAGDVFRFAAGSFNAANLNNNFLATAVTATVVTFRAINGNLPVNEGPIATATLTVVGKKAKPPLTGHTKDYFTIEEWYPDIAKSELFTDMKVDTIAITVPNSGNVTIDFDWLGLARALNSTQQSTTPAASSTTNVVASATAVIVVDGAAITVTGITLTIDPSVAASDGEVGSNQVDDMNIGRIKVTGQFTAKFRDSVIQILYENQSVIPLYIVVTDSGLPGADFVAFNLPALKFFGDAPDDGEKEIVRTYPFTAQINAAGGPALQSDKTILTVQDSQA